MEKATKDLSKLDELFKEFWSEFLEFVARIEFCSGDCSPNPESAIPAIGLVRDTTAKSFDKLNEIYEEKEKFIAAQNPS